MPTLVTGGTGFIGQRLVSRLLERCEPVRLLVRHASNLAPFSGQSVEFAYGDVTDRASVESALAGCNRLYHLANVYDWWIPDYSQYYRVNVEGTRGVLEAALAAGVEKVVYTSSYVTIPGARGEVFNEKTPHRGYFVCEYERTKYLGEQVALELAKKGLPVVCVLPTGVYGPGDTKAIGRFIVAYLKRRLPGYIEVRTNMVYVDDVVEGHILAMEKGKVGERYILGGDNFYSSQLFSLIADLEGRSWMPPRLPYWMGPAIALMYETMSRVTKKPPLISRDFVRYFRKPVFVDNTRARTELGLTFTPLREGIRRHIAWLRDVGQI